MIVTTKELYKKAREGGYAIGAFNISTIEAIRAIIGAVDRLQAPVIIETSPGEMNYVGAKNVVDIITNLTKNLEIPVAIHLDHGQNLEQVKQAIDAGYTSVHIDASALPFDENLKVTAEVVEYAHSKGITVEGELGQIPGASEAHDEEINIADTALTDPMLAKEFVEKTNLDILASSVGNVHGIYKGEPDLDFARIEKIGQIGVPLSLHGGSGIPAEQVKRAISLGITKVNVNTELRMAFTTAIKSEFEAKPEAIVPYKYLPKAAQAMQAVVEEKIKLFGSSNKA